MFHARYVRSFLMRLFMEWSSVPLGVENPICGDHIWLRFIGFPSLSCLVRAPAEHIGWHGVRHIGHWGCSLVLKSGASTGGPCRFPGFHITWCGGGRGKMVDVSSGLFEDAEKLSPCKCLPIHSGPYMLFFCIDRPNDRVDPKQNESTQTYWKSDFPVEPPTLLQSLSMLRILWAEIIYQRRKCYGNRGNRSHVECWKPKFQYLPGRLRLGCVLLATNGPWQYQCSDWWPKDRYVLNV